LNQVPFAFVNFATKRCLFNQPEEQISRWRRDGHAVRAVAVDSGMKYISVMPT
jgi:hypothetical protein